jgi:hypothetical protein
MMNRFWSSLVPNTATMSAPPSPRDPIDVELGRLPWYGFIAIPIGALLFISALVLSLDGLMFPLAAFLLLEATFLAAALWPAQLLGGVVVAWLSVVLTALSLLGVTLFFIAAGGTGFLVSVAIVESAVVALVGALLVLQLLVVVHRLRGLKHARSDA